MHKRLRQFKVGIMLQRATLLPLDLNCLIAEERDLARHP